MIWSKNKCDFYKITSICIIIYSKHKCTYYARPFFTLHTFHLFVIFKKLLAGEHYQFASKNNFLLCTEWKRYYACITGQTGNVLNTFGGSLVHLTQVVETYTSYEPSFFLKDADLVELCELCLTCTCASFLYSKRI